MKFFMTLLMLLVMPAAVLASGGGQEAAGAVIDFTQSIYGYLGIAMFVLAYCLVPFEEVIHLRKSKPVILAAGVIWVLVALAYAKVGDTHTAHEAIKHGLLEYAELFLFLLVAMTYINSLEERGVFQCLRAFLVSRGFTLVKIYWITGVLAFFLSPIADNLTTALLMGAVAMAVGGDNKKFVVLACINIVVAANAGGAFSPFGDITTLMVWQKGKVNFIEFFDLFIPSAINWLVPAFIMMFAIGKAEAKLSSEKATMKYGAVAMMIFFLLTIMTAVSFHNFLGLPPAAGMMLGLGYLGFLSYHVKRREGSINKYDPILGSQRYMPFKPIWATEKSKKDISSIMDSIPYPAMAIGTDGKVTHWNKPLEGLTGVSAEERIGTDQHWSPFWPEKRKILVDMVLENASQKEFEENYGDKQRPSEVFESGHRAARFFPTIGKNGTNLVMTAAPVRDQNGKVIGAIETIRDTESISSEQVQFDLMHRIARAEWDTLLFFYGVIMCVGGLSQFGYLSLVSHQMYVQLGATWANVLVGVLSAIVDNIPVMFAVLTMNPEMSHGQWLLVTLTAGVGGSLLSIGSAAGVALMGTARGVYTFGAHLKWAPVIALGYILAILSHLWINSSLMHM
ncbi:sodium:proton antiporter NhaD [Desulfobacter latus]|uniref:Sodium:proton antiporter NhaD n=1 Tax=Desulfobacter latus TaxID=2292 RepID=A0A850T8P6_9BACT|nr:sodium:proton antiporter NhaD [Desulfobacter latus]NWH05565.1 sodium:proton antiporter NhaD [Desulfobacter latus]